MSKEEIIKQLRGVTAEFINSSSAIEVETFFHQPKEKWSIAQNVNHLTISAHATRIAFLLPKFIIRLYTGTPNRSSRSYDELVTRYKLKLQQGGKASGRYIPKTISPTTGKENSLLAFATSMDKLIRAIEKKTSDAQLDQYIAPHPLLGKITLRELCYFTIYHTIHHLAIINERIQETTG